MTLSADQCGGSAGRIKCRAANINDAVSVWRKWWNANFWQKKKTVEEKEEEEEKAGGISNERRGDRFGGGSPFLGLLKHFKEGRVCVCICLINLDKLDALGTADLFYFQIQTIPFLVFSCFITKYLRRCPRIWMLKKMSKWLFNCLDNVIKGGMPMPFRRHIAPKTTLLASKICVAPFSCIIINKCKKLNCKRSLNLKLR